MAENNLNINRNMYVNPAENKNFNDLLRKVTDTSLSFEALLKQEVQKSSSLQFSKHAQQRVEQRGIELSPTLMNDLSTAVEKAREKGSRDVVIIGGQSAFIVNVPNNIVVTTMSGNELKENIFTNIDSAVIL